MHHTELTWHTHDGLRLFAQIWEPDSLPKGVVCLLHGLGEHSGRYLHVAAGIVESGYALLAFDLRGHGQSAGPRGHSPSLDALLSDVDLLRAEGGQRFVGLPVFLYGHSLGAILAINYVLRRRPQLGGVIATGAAFRSSLQEQTAKLALVRVLGAVLPALALPSGLRPFDLSRNPKVVSAYVSDPLVHNKLTLGLARSLLQAIVWTFEHMHEFSVPLLLMHGGSDRLGYPEGAQEYGSLVRDDCTIRIWDQLYHEIHNEPEQAEVLGVIISWLQAHTPQPA